MFLFATHDPEDHTMKRSSAVILALALLAPGCWAEFPDERFNQDGAQADASIIDTTTQPEAGQDMAVDAPADGMQPDTVAPDTAADTAAPDTAADTAAPDTAPDTAAPDTVAPDTVAPDTAPDTVAPDTVAPDTAPDTVAPDTVAPDTVPPPDTVPWPDAFVCVPNAFLLCNNNTLLRCNATGDNVVSEDCSPYLCNATAGRCNECTIGDPPWCENNDLAICLANGLKQTTACGSLGCQNGACCVDSDGDTYDTCTPDADCLDSDADVNPGQTVHQAGNSNGGDYNCDGNVDQQWTDLFTACQKSGGGCIGHGWDASTPPGCGVTAKWITCVKSGNCVPDTPGTDQTQACL
jgi:hypothetical protein